MTDNETLYKVEREPWITSLYFRISCSKGRLFKSADFRIIGKYLIFIRVKQIVGLFINHCSIIYTFIFVNFHKVKNSSRQHQKMSLISERKIPKILSCLGYWLTIIFVHIRKLIPSTTFCQRENEGEQGGGEVGWLREGRQEESNVWCHSFDIDFVSPDLFRYWILR